MAEMTVDEEKLNIEIRKFLKKVGITSQREIEQSVRAARAAGRLRGNETLSVQVTLSMPTLNLTHRVDGDIALG
jgi:ribosomal protein L1